MNLPPGPKGLPLFGNVFEPRGDAVGYFTKCLRESVKSGIRVIVTRH